MNQQIVTEIRVRPELPPAELFKEVSYWEAYEKRIPIYNMQGSMPTGVNPGERVGKNYFLYPGMRMIWQKAKNGKPIQGYLVGFDNESADPVVFMVPKDQEFPHADWMDASPWYSQKANIKMMQCFSTTYIFDYMVFYAGVNPVAEGAGVQAPAGGMPKLFDVPNAPPVMGTYTPSIMAIPAQQQVSMGSVPRQVQTMLETTLAQLIKDGKSSPEEAFQAHMKERMGNTDMIAEFALRKMRKVPKNTEIKEIKDFYVRLGKYLLGDNPEDFIKFITEEPEK